MKTIPQSQKKRLLCLLILYLVVPAPIFCQTSPSPLPSAVAAQPPAPLGIPNPFEPISRELFATLKKVNPFQAVLDNINATNNPQPDVMPLAAAISVVQQALEKYQRLQRDYEKNDSSKEGKNDLNSATLPDIESAEFGFKVTQKKSVGADISWFIITISGKIEDQNVKEVTFTYSVPKPGKGLKEVSLQAEKPLTLQEDLVPTLQQAALAAKNDFTWGGKNFTKKITVNLEYGVGVKLEVGAKIPVYTLIVGPNASWDKNAVQSVKLVFGK